MSHPGNNQFWCEYLNPRLAMLKGAKIVKAITTPDSDGHLWVELHVALPSEKGRIYKFTVQSDAEGNRPGFLDGLPDPA